MQWRSKCCHFSGSKKAFDTVNHNIIMQKLHSYGITGDELKFLGRTSLIENNAAVSMVRFQTMRT